MARGDARQGRRVRPGTIAALAALLLAAAAGVAWTSAARDADRRAAPPTPPRAPAGRPTAPEPALQPAKRVQMPIRVRIVIPAIGVDARVLPLGLNPDRTIEVPKALADAGWFTPGPEPGETGAAVIVGHVAARSGPGVFLRLAQLRPGRLIRIRLQDGSTVTYVARSMIRVPKDRFPTKRVYARTPEPTLRLITCAGLLDPVTGSHRDNYIVFATLA